MMKKLLFLINGLFVAFSLLLCVVFARADDYNTINIQGRVTTDSGQPLSGEQYTMFLTIYDSGNNFTKQETGYLDDEGLYNKNVDISGFFTSGRTFDKSYEFDVKITAGGKEATSKKSFFAASPYSFYASTASYSLNSSTSSTAMALSASAGSSKLVNENFYGYDPLSESSHTYTIKVDTAVYAGESGLISVSTTAVETVVWGLDGGTQKWIDVAKDIKVENAKTADKLNAGAGTTKLIDGNFETAATVWSATNTYSIAVGSSSYSKNLLTQAQGGTYLSDGNFTPGAIYAVKVGTATYASKSGEMSVTGGAGQVWSMLDSSNQGWTSGITVSSTNYLNTKTEGGTVLADDNFNQSSTGLSYNIVVGTANYLSTSGTPLANGNFNQLSTHYVYNIAVSSSAYAADLDPAFELKTTNFKADEVYPATVTYSQTLSKTFKLDDGNFETDKVYQATASYASTAGTAATSSGLENSVIETEHFKYNNDYTQQYNIKVGTAAYAADAGAAATSSGLEDSIIETAHFKYNNNYTQQYNIKVGTAVYAESAGTVSNYSITTAKLAADAKIKYAEEINNTATISNASQIWAKDGGTQGWINAADLKTAIGADLAEIYSSSEVLQPGDVVSIDTTKDNAIVKTKTADDILVAGVISTEPGLLLNKNEKGYKLALVGKVPTKVCNEGGSIKRGDLLVSSSQAGYAKKASEQPKAGTVIGKALENFDSSKGTILVLVNLQ